MQEIILSDGSIATVDDEDYIILSCYKYSPTKNGYAKRSVRIDGKDYKISMHREIMGVTDPNIKIDHRNGKKLCNERWNLRIATSVQNNINREAPNIIKTSKYKGVSKSGRRWRSVTTVNNKTIHIGIFDTEELAAIAYNIKVKELHGEFAYLNVIGGGD